MTRPREISLFAALAFAASFLNMVTTLIVTRLGKEGLTGSMLGLTIIAILLFWTVRGRSLAGRLVTTAWLAFGIVTSISGFAMILFGQHSGLMSAPVMALAILTLALNIAAVFYLWSRTSTNWLLG